MNITVNGEITVCNEGATLLDLILRLGLSPEKIVVERNRDIVPAGTFAETALQDGDTLELTHDMTPHVVYASPKVAADTGKACVQRGALVYCAEEADNGPVLPLCIRDGAAPKALAFEPETLGGIVPVTIAGWEVQDSGALYSTKKPALVEKEIRLIPYYTWANRGENQMRVWLPVK